MIFLYCFITLIFLRTSYISFIIIFPKKKELYFRIIVINLLLIICDSESNIKISLFSKGIDDINLSLLYNSL